MAKDLSYHSDTPLFSVVNVNLTICVTLLPGYTHNKRGNYYQKHQCFSNFSSYTVEHLSCI